MAFKDMVQSDLSIFINLDEFAETHTINLNSVSCIVDDSRNNSSKKYYDGTTTTVKDIFVKSLDVGIIEAGSYIEHDGDLYVVNTVLEHDGITTLQLDKPIGKFNRTITIQQSTTVKVDGFPKELWTNWHSSVAYVRNMSADDMLKMGAIVNNKTIFVKMPYIDGITTDMRVVFNGKAYAITSVDNIENDNVFIDLICEVRQ